MRSGNGRAAVGRELTFNLNEGADSCTVYQAAGCNRVGAFRRPLETRARFLAAALDAHATSKRTSSRPGQDIRP